MMAGFSMKLNGGKLMKQPDWGEWNASEFPQLDQYDKQNMMFGQPVKVDNASAIFHLEWTYVIKELDSRKKARCVCDGSPRFGQVRVLDHTYANCVDHRFQNLLRHFRRRKSFNLRGRCLKRVCGGSGA
jgi:hypothetical protein